MRFLGQQLAWPAETMVWFACAGALVVACGHDASSPQAGPSTVPPVETPDAIDPGAVEMPVQCGTTGNTGVQRLTRGEYDRTAADLLATTAKPSERLPEDNRANVFDNNAQVNGITGAAAAAYFEAGDILAQDLITRKPPAIISCEPSAAVSGEACASEILGRLVRKAYRRPTEPAELEAVLAVYRAGQAQGHDVALQNAIHAVLVAPQFLFKGITASLGAAHDLDQHAMAARLSYFLWGSLPDDALSLLADQAELAKPEVVLAQVQRMLLDTRASALVDSFAGQWLSLRMLAVAEPDKALFPEFSPTLKGDMLAESQTFVRSVLSDAAPIRDLLTAPYSFVNGNLATYYGLALPPGVSPDVFSRVDTSGTDRRGILTQAAILTVTSNPDRTSVVRRGKWVLDNIMCQPLPPPPNGVNVTLPDPKTTANKFEQLELHRTDPVCNACHRVMDPLGFALEAFDPIGRVRGLDETGRPLYTTGTLPDGAVVNGARELADYLANTGEFESCMATNLLTYALGRELTEADQCVLAGVLGKLDLGTVKFSSLVTELALSPAFRTEGAAP